MGLFFQPAHTRTMSSSEDDRIPSAPEDDSSSSSSSESEDDGTWKCETAGFGDFRDPSHLGEMKVQPPFEKVMDIYEEEQDRLDKVADEEILQRRKLMEI